jgi:hypothetical protein
MKLKHLAITFALLLCSVAASAWPCPSGQIRQQAPAGTPTSTPYYDVVEGIAFICVPTPQPPTTPNPTTSNSNSTSNASSNSAANAGATATATGGKATATGGNASQSQKQSQNQVNNQQQNTSQNANSSASNQGNNSSYNSESTFNQVRQAPLAYAPTIIPSNCQGSLSGGVSAPIGGISLGGSKADKNCQRLALAAAFAAMRNFAAAAKVLCSTDGAKTAKLTLSDCQATFEQPAPQIVYVPTPAPVVVAPAVAPEVKVIMIEPPITVTAPKVVRHSVKRKATGKCPVVPESLKHPQPLEK